MAGPSASHLSVRPEETRCHAWGESAIPQEWSPAQGPCLPCSLRNSAQMGRGNSVDTRPRHHQREPATSLRLDEIGSWTAPHGAIVAAAGPVRRLAPDVAGPPHRDPKGRATGRTLLILLYRSASSAPRTAGTTPKSAARLAANMCVRWVTRCTTLRMFRTGSSAPPLLLFCNSGSCSGKGIKNNAASGENSHYKYLARVYCNSGYKGAQDVIGPYQYIDRFPHVYNQNASFQWT
ncbi:hypothetical protein SAMN05428945_4236 [Streptomyces sp. 2224.1]|nr:hypothetical protein SAMN05428945_4236 [Streptomyces sp. 2224.1]